MVDRIGEHYRPPLNKSFVAGDSQPKNLSGNLTVIAKRMVADGVAIKTAARYLDCAPAVLSRSIAPKVSKPSPNPTPETKPFGDPPLERSALSTRKHREAFQREHKAKYWSELPLPVRIALARQYENRPLTTAEIAADIGERTGVVVTRGAILGLFRREGMILGFGTKGDYQHVWRDRQRQAGRERYP